DLVSELETVRDGLCCAVDSNVYAFNEMVLDAAAECVARQMDYAERRMIHCRPPRLLVNCDPDLERVLCCQLVEAECGEQANDAAWHALRRLNQTVLFSQVGIGHGVQATTYSLEFACINQTLEVDARDAVTVELLWAKNARLSNQIK